MFHNYEQFTGVIDEIVQYNLGNKVFTKTLKEAEDENLVLIIGSTGAGKSTINNLIIGQHGISDFSGSPCVRYCDLTISFLKKGRTSKKTIKSFNESVERWKGSYFDTQHDFNGFLFIYSHTDNNWKLYHYAKKVTEPANIFNHNELTDIDMNIVNNGDYVLANKSKLYYINNGNPEPVEISSIDDLLEDLEEIRFEEGNRRRLTAKEIRDIIWMNTNMGCEIKTLTEESDKEVYEILSTIQIQSINQTIKNQIHTFLNNNYELRSNIKNNTFAGKNPEWSSSLISILSLII